MIRRMTVLLALLFLTVCALPPGVQAVELSLSAPSAVLMELETGTILYEANAHERLAPASVTKVMTLLLIMEALDDGRITLSDPVTASESAAAKGGSQVYLKVGETMTVDEMLKSITVSSANDCACAMAEHLAGSEAAFVEQMNQRAKELGMEDTHFVNCTGLDDEDSAREHLTSAYDIALMSRELLKNHPAIRNYTTIWMDTVRGGAFGLANTNKLVRFYPGTTGLKTGYTSSAGHCLSASAQRDGLELIAVVLHCASSTDRFQSAKALLDYGFAGFSLIPAWEDELPELPVTLGNAGSVSLEIRGADKLLIDKARRSGVQRELLLPEAVPAPVRAGQQVGLLRITSGEELFTELPITAAAEVPKLSFLQIFRTILGKI